MRNNEIGSDANALAFTATSTNTTATVTWDGATCFSLNKNGTISPASYTTTARNALTNLAAGQIVYNTSTNKLNVYTGSAWEAVTSA